SLKGWSWIETPPIPIETKEFQDSISLGLAVEVSTGQGNLFAEPRAFARFSLDEVHWTSWQPFSDLDPSEDGNTSVRLDKFSGPGKPYWIGEVHLAATSSEFDSLMDLRNQWVKTSPNRKHEVSEFLGWVHRNKPNYFLNHIPLIRFVQI